MKDSKYFKSFEKIPEVMRFMDNIVKEMGYNVSMFKTLKGRYYASLQAFELESLKVLGKNYEAGLKAINDGTLDKRVSNSLKDFIVKRGISIPLEVKKYGGLSGMLANVGRNEYVKLDNARMKAGKSPLIFLVMRSKKDLNEKLTNTLMTRRDYLLSYKSKDRYFLGKVFNNIKENIQENRDERQERREERRENRNQRQIDKIEARQTARTDRASIRNQDGNLGQNLLNSAGGIFDSIFNGQGAIPSYNDPQRFENTSTSAENEMLMRAETPTTAGMSTQNLGVALGAGALLLLIYFGNKKK